VEAPKARLPEHIWQIQAYCYPRATLPEAPGKACAATTGWNLKRHLAHGGGAGGACDERPFGDVRFTSRQCHV
jgi:hypothetical protein